LLNNNENATVPKSKNVRELNTTLVGEMKIFECHIECLTRCREGFSDTNLKTNFRTHLETTR